MHQAVRIKGVVNTIPPLNPKSETKLSAALPNGLPNGALLLCGRTIFLRQMLGDVLAAGGHIGVELKGLYLHLGRDFRSHPGQRLL